MASWDGADKQRVRKDDTQGGDSPEDSDEDRDGRRHEYVWHTVDVPSELVQAGPEQGRKAAGIARGDLTGYTYTLENRHGFYYVFQ